ncbi:MAG: hypothetical protein II913_03160, partial [Elusimicrobiaceae bacterium]|nr:hypothetical protein [Elusimicrobiaceae bacterium]
MRTVKKPKTFKKATEAARILTQEQQPPALSFHTVKVGMSKKALAKLEREKNRTQKPAGKHNFKKF